IPVEALTERYAISYVPSGTIFAKLREKHRPLHQPSLLALGDPEFKLPTAGPVPKPPDHGVLLSLVLPGSNAHQAGLQSGDVLLRYGSQKLVSLDDLKPVESGDKVPVSVWRNGKVLDNLRVAPGRLGVSISKDPVDVALRKQRELTLLADARRRDEI